MNKVAISVLCAVFILCVPSVGAVERETIAIIGTGDLGDSLGARLAGLGYTIVYGSRTPDSDRVKALVATTGKWCICRDSTGGGTTGRYYLFAHTLAGHGDGGTKSGQP